MTPEEIAKEHAKCHHAPFYNDACCRDCAEAVTRKAIASAVKERDEALEKYAEVCIDLNEAKVAIAAERERWQRYVELLGAELDELAPFAASHGWKSSRYEEGKRLRAELGIEGAGDRTEETQR